MNADLSRRVFSTMDCFRYGAQQREFRIRAYGNMDRSSNKILEEGSQITVGSKGEGITNIYESDCDVLTLFRNVICIERSCPPPILPRDTAVFVCNTDLCYHGHTFLEVVRPSTDAFYQDCYVPIGSKYYLSSTAFSRNALTTLTECLGPSDETQGIIGPAVTLKSSGLDHDFVHVLPCYCPSLLHAWLNRPRFHNWPSPELRQKVVNLGAVVAPTSHYLSFNKQLEWRICFNAGETELVMSFCETQIKLYILLKVVKKDVLKPESKEITSYVMKNIVFWLAEFNPTEDFHSDTLVDWLLKALEFLYQAVKQNMLPYYMIPQRNLLAGKMEPHQRDTMLTRLDDALHSGPALLYQCGRIGRALTIVNPDRLIILGNTRNELEMLILIIRTRRLELLHQYLTSEQTRIPVANDSICMTCAVRAIDIVLPGWRMLKQLGVDVATILNERIESILT